MHRREFMKVAAAGCLPRFLPSSAASQAITLTDCVVMTPSSPSIRENKAISVLVEEVEKRTGLRWTVRPPRAAETSVAIYAGTRMSWKAFGPRISSVADSAMSLKPEGYAIRVGDDTRGRWIAICGADERGLLFGLGKLLRSISFRPQEARTDARLLNISTTPRYRLRGHQLGYRPKTNSYDAWTVSTWDQYIRDLVVFGTNAIELVPPRSDDAPNSPHFPLPPEQMMTEMSRLADNYGMDVWIWYPAMDKDYSDSAAVEFALKEWARIFELLPRIDAVFVPGGDPGHTAPRYLLALLEKQKANLRRFHPKAQMWISPQSFGKQWLDEFFEIVAQNRTKSWLDGVVFGPQNRLSLAELRKQLPSNYPIRFYPDITHSVQCQYPVPEWDVAYVLTEGREVINPRPIGEANIFRRFSPETIGFITYSEGCNDDVNKFVWSALGWDPDQNVAGILREFAHYFVGETWADDFARGVLDLEDNWRLPLAANDRVPTTLAKFQSMERAATPAMLENWRFQQVLYRAYYDASVRSRLLRENARLQQAFDLLGSMRGIGWTPEPLDISEPPSKAPPNGLEPNEILETAIKILSQTEIESETSQLRHRVRELGEALFQSIRMQLAVQRYQGEAVVRGANLETLDYPVTDVAWLRKRLVEIRAAPDANQQVKAIRQLLDRTNPGPGGFYDELGNPSNRCHLVLGPGSIEDPEFRQSALTGFNYPDELGDSVPVAWKRWAESLYDAPLLMQYTGLDRDAQYDLRVVYSGDEPGKKVRLIANEEIEIHSLLTRPWPPRPLDFAIPRAATAQGELRLQWTREPGMGGNGRGCQVSEVWLMKRRAEGGG